MIVPLAVEASVLGIFSICITIALRLRSPDSSLHSAREFDKPMGDVIENVSLVNFAEFQRRDHASATTKT